MHQIGATDGCLDNSLKLCICPSDCYLGMLYLRFYVKEPKLRDGEILQFNQRYADSRSIELSSVNRIGKLLASTGAVLLRFGPTGHEDHVTNTEAARMHCAPSTLVSKR